MFQLIYYLVEAIQPVLVPLCFFFAWTFVALLGWSLLSAIRDAAARAKRMHEIPCTNCQFFNNDYRLKCTVQPFIANTEKAIDCSDYRLKKNPFAATEKFRGSGKA
ncbi:MAG: hypothetical protein AB4426_23055 [Xenococcaceae cyanobacterium]